MDNAGWLIIPVILIRYLLLRSISKDAFRRASHFPPLKGRERHAFYLYQTAIIFMLFYTVFLHIKAESVIDFIGRKPDGLALWMNAE